MKKITSNRGMRRRRWEWRGKPSATPTTPSKSLDSTTQCSWDWTQNRTQSLGEGGCTSAANPGCKDLCPNSSWCLPGSNAVRGSLGTASGRILLVASSRTFVPEELRWFPGRKPSRRRQNIWPRVLRRRCRSGPDLCAGSGRDNNRLRRKLKDSMIQIAVILGMLRET